MRDWSKGYLDNNMAKKKKVHSVLVNSYLDNIMAKKKKVQSVLVNQK
jgi:hypothetical protein